MARVVVVGGGFGGLVLLYTVATLVRRGWRRWKGRDRVPDPA